MNKQVDSTIGKINNFLLSDGTSCTANSKILNDAVVKSMRANPIVITNNDIANLGLIQKMEAGIRHNEVVGVNQNKKIDELDVKTNQFFEMAQGAVHDVKVTTTAMIKDLESHLDSKADVADFHDLRVDMITHKNNVKDALVEKANRSDLRNLATEVETNFDILRHGIYETKNDIKYGLSQKVDKSELDNVIADFQEMQDQKINYSEHRALAHRTSMLEESMSEKQNKFDMKDYITRKELNKNMEETASKKDVMTLLNIKADKAYVKALFESKEDFIGKISTKADQKDVRELTNRVDHLENGMAYKADKTDLVNKANVSDLRLKADADMVYTKAEMDDRLKNLDTLSKGAIEHKIKDSETRINDRLNRMFDEPKLETRLATLKEDINVETNKKLAQYVRELDLKDYAKEADLDALKHDVVTLRELATQTGDVQLTSYYRKAEIDNLLDNKVSAAEFTKLKNNIEWVKALSGGDLDASNYYTKGIVNRLLNDKADATNVYSRREIDDIIRKIDGRHLIGEVGEGLELKADKSEVYTKAEVESKLKAFTTAAEVAKHLEGKVDLTAMAAYATKDDLTVFSNKLDSKLDAAALNGYVKTTALDSVEGKFAEYYTKEQIDGKFKAFQPEVDTAGILEDVNKKIEDLTNKLNASSTVGASKEDITKVAAAANQKIDDVNETLTKKAQEIDTKVDTKVAEINEVVAKAQQLIDTLKSTVETQQNIIKEQATKISNLELLIEDLNEN